jgi:hypothetical protein
MVFVFSYVFEWLIRRPTFLVWARIVESEKPLFTQLLCRRGTARAAAAEITNLTVSIKSTYYTHFFIRHVRNDGCERAL